MRECIIINNMKAKKTVILVLSALCVLGATSCKGSNENEYLTYQNGGYAFSTQYLLSVTDKFNINENKNAVVELYSQIYYFISETERSLSVTIEDSSVNDFNEAEAGVTVEIDKTVYEVLSLALEMHEFTAGYYNPAVYYTVDMYGFSRKSNTNAANPPYLDMGSDGFPQEKYVTAFKELATTFKDVKLSQTDGKYYATKPQNGYVVIDETVNGEQVQTTYNLKIDLGGIGKGYVVDKVNDMITDAGFKNGYFNFGSSSMYVKNFYGEESGNYVLTLADPRSQQTGTGSYLNVSAKNCAVSTSGDYVQYYIIGDSARRICHIINPFTGQPIQTGIMAATVIGGTAAKGDALSTAICAMGAEKAVEFINEYLTEYQIAMAVETESGYGIITNVKDYTKSQSYTVINTLSENGEIIL